MKKLQKAQRHLQEVKESFSEVFGDTQAADLFAAAGQLLDFEISKAENRAKFASYDDNQVQKVLEQEQQEAIRRNQEAAAAELERILGKKQKPKVEPEQELEADKDPEPNEEDGSEGNEEPEPDKDPEPDKEEGSEGNEEPEPEPVKPAPKSKAAKSK